MDGLPDEAFTEVKSGDTVRISLNIAFSFDVKQGGLFEVEAKGLLPVAGQDSNELVDGIEFETPSIKVRIDEDDDISDNISDTLSEGGSEGGSDLEKRSVITDSCTTEQRRALEDLHDEYAQLATAAINSALKGSEERYGIYFLYCGLQ